MRVIINPSITRAIGGISVPFAVGFAFAVYPMASLGHSKGIYQTKADAEKRAGEIG